MLSLYFLFLSLYDEPYFYYDVDGEKLNHSSSYYSGSISSGHGILHDKSLVFFNCPMAKKLFAEPLRLCHYAECSYVVRADYVDVGRGYQFFPYYVSIPSLGVDRSKVRANFTKYDKPINDFGFSIYLSYYSFGQFVDVKAKDHSDQGFLFNVFDNRLFEYRDILKQNCSIPSVILTYISKTKDALSRQNDKCTITFRVESYSDFAVTHYYEFSKRILDHDKLFLNLHFIDDFLIGTFVNCRESRRNSPVNLNLFPFAEIKI